MGPGVEASWQLKVGVSANVQAAQRIGGLEADAHGRAAELDAAHADLARQTDAADAASPRCAPPLAHPCIAGQCSVAASRMGRLIKGSRMLRNHSQTSGVQFLADMGATPQPACNGLLQRSSGACAANPASTHGTPVGLVAAVISILLLTGSSILIYCFMKRGTLHAGRYVYYHWSSRSAPDMQGRRTTNSACLCCAQQQGRMAPSMTRRPDSYDPEAALLSDEENSAICDTSEPPGLLLPSLPCCAAFTHRASSAWLPRCLLRPATLAPVCQRSQLYLNRRAHAASIAAGRALPPVGRRGPAAARACSGNIRRARPRPGHLCRAALAAGGFSEPCMCRKGWSGRPMHRSWLRSRLLWCMH